MDAAHIEICPEHMPKYDEIIAIFETKKPVDLFSLDNILLYYSGIYFLHCANYGQAIHYFLAAQVDELNSKSYVKMCYEKLAMNDKYDKFCVIYRYIGQIKDGDYTNAYRVAEFYHDETYYDNAADYCKLGIQCGSLEAYVIREKFGIVLTSEEYEMYLIARSNTFNDVFSLHKLANTYNSIGNIEQAQYYYDKLNIIIASRDQ